MPHSRTTTKGEEFLDAIPVADTWVRGMLVGLALGFAVVLGIACWLDPYQRDLPGQPARRMETHRQLGLPPCGFYTATGIPCPACGMTTSFALLMHGDPVNSLRANAVGTLLAAFGVLFVPWALVSAWRGRTLFLRSLEAGVAVVVVTFLALMLLRWAIVLGLALWQGGGKL